MELETKNAELRPYLVAHRQVTEASKQLCCKQLCKVAALGHLKAAVLLLDDGADPSLPNSNGHTPLMLGAAKGHKAMVELLIDRGAEVDAVELKKGGTAFHLACSSNQPDCAAALIEAGCNTAAKSLDGLSGRQLAELFGHTAVLERLRAMVAEQVRAS